MPALLLEDVPPDVYERLQELAVATNQPIAAAAVEQLRKSLPASGYLPLPKKEMRDEVVDVPMWLPAPPFLSEEISAPCDLPLPGEKVRVKARDVPMWLPDPPILPEEQ